MKEDENIAKYVERIKANFSTIKASRGTIEDVTVVRKVLITLLPIYAIRVSFIQEMRCDPNNKITLDALVGRLTAFELDNYDNYTPSSRNIDLKPRYHSRRKLKSLKENNVKVKRKKILTVILKTLKFLLQEGIPKAKESIKIKFL